MFAHIDLSKPLIKPKLYLCKPNKQKIASLKEAIIPNHKIRQGNFGINELSFRLPYEIELRHQLVTNPHIALIRSKYLIELVKGVLTEYYVINNITDIMEESVDYKNIVCSALPSEMKNEKFKSYKKEAVNAEQVLTDVLKTAYDVTDIANALWTIDYISPIYNNTYRTFEMSEKTLLEFILNDIKDTFVDSVPMFDSVNRTISLYHKDEIPTYKGLKFSYGHYLKTLSKELNPDEFYTRFEMYGRDNLSIQDVNPNGKNHVDDYTYFLDAYEETTVGLTITGTTTTNITINNHGLVTGDYIVNKTRSHEVRVITVVDVNNFTVSAITGQTVGDNIYKITAHSDYMSDALCSAIFDYNTLLASKCENKDTAETGTTPTNIRMTAHGLSSGDWILNKSRNNVYRKVTVVDADNVAVSAITDQTALDIIYKYPSGTFRHLLFEKEELQTQLTALENELVNLKTEQNIILDTIGIQLDANTYTTYDFTYGGTLTTKTTSLNSSYKYITMCKVSSITNLIVKLNTVTKTLIPDTWTVLGKLGSLTSSSVEVSGSATSVDIRIVVLRITEDEYSASGNETALIDKYCLGKIEIEINAKNTEITNKNTEISSKDVEINNLVTSLSYEANFTLNQLKELKQFTIKDIWNNDNYINSIDLYEAGLDEFSKRRQPKAIININIVNFLECITEQLNWDKLNLGDIVRIKYDKLNTDVKAQMVEFDFNYETGDIGIVIANYDLLLSNKDKFAKNLYQSMNTTKQLQNDKINWNTIANNFDGRNDRISTIPANPVVANDGTAIYHTLNTDGSANISFEWSFEGTGDAYNIDGFLVYVKALESNESYTFGSATNPVNPVYIPKDQFAHIIMGVPANKFYTFGIQSYRRVDADINSDGILLSEIIKSTYDTENPYLPCVNVDFKGNIADTANINGVSASEITTQLADIASDNKLTPVEKQGVREKWDVIAAEKAGLDTLAINFSITTEKTTYDGAFQDLADYLNAGVTWVSGVPTWINNDNLGTTTDIVGITFRSNFQTYYDAKTALLNAINNKTIQSNKTYNGVTINTTDGFLLKDALGNIIITGNNTGFLVENGGAYKIKDYGLACQILNKGNLIFDHSFELLRKIGDISAYGDYEVEVYPYYGEGQYAGRAIQLNWSKFGSPKIAPRMFESEGVSYPNALFSAHSIIVDTDNCVAMILKDVICVPHTLSAYHVQYLSPRRSVVGSKLKLTVKYYNSSDTLLQTFTQTFNSSTTPMRSSMTFTPPVGSSYGYLYVQGADGWIYADGMQLVTNDSPIIYDPQDALFAEIKQINFDMVGMIQIFAGGLIPPGWLLCDGSAISRTVYRTLFDAILTNHGEGDGVTTFNLPDLRGKFPIAWKINSPFDTFGGTGGEENHVLTIDEMPSHSHPGSITNIGFGTGGGSSIGKLDTNNGSGNVGDRWGATIASQGGGLAHNNLPPFIVLNFIIKY